MAGRYTITSTPEEIHKRYHVDVPENYRKRYNAAPTQLLPIISSNSPDRLSFFHWGLIPQIAKNKTIATKLINARSDSINDKISFKNSLKSRRCIVPVDGFYEWKSISKKSSIPYRISMQSGELFSLAGLWESFEDDKGNEVFTFTIITTEANADVAKIHDRMPVILAPEEEQIWLHLKTDENKILDMLTPYPDHNLRSYAVSIKVNDLANDSPDLIMPAPPADQFGNYSLFD